MGQNVDMRPLGKLVEESLKNLGARCRVSKEHYYGLFERFSKSADRIEARARYKVADNGYFDAFESGSPLPPYTPTEWLEEIKRNIAGGKSMTLLRLIPREITTYFRMEVEWGYPQAAQAGQEVRFILPGKIEQVAQSSAVPDVWIFDRSTIAVIGYDNQDVPTDYFVASEPSLVRPLVRLCDLLSSESMTFQSFLSIYRSGELNIRGCKS